MKKIFTLLSVVLFATSIFAATEQAWYNDVTSISNGNYYIYSANGKGFMQAGQSKVKTVNNSNYTSSSDLLFTITAQTDGKAYNGSQYVSSYQAGTCGPTGSSSDDGSQLIWTLMNSGAFWNIHGHYTAFFAERWAALSYNSGSYSAKANVTGGKKDYTDAQYQWYVISQAQYNRHWAIYAYDVYKETVTDYTKYEGKVPAAYYTALKNACTQSFSVKNAEHSAEVVNAAKANAKTLYDNAATVAEAYASAKASIKALEDVEDKGEGDLTKITNDITAARAAIEKAMSVADLNAVVATLKAIDPITFNVTTFTALETIGSPAASTQGRTITYDAADKNIISAAGLALYKGTTTLTATAAETDKYYAFVRTAKVTVNPINNEGNEIQVVCDGEPVKYQGETFTTTTKKDFLLVNRTGGDSTVHFSLTVNPVYNLQETKTIVYGDKETWNGNDLSTQTVGKHELKYETSSVFGCDSVVTLTLTVNKQATLEVNVPFEFCEGGSETFRGVTYSEDGIYKVPATGDVRDTMYVVNVKVNLPSEAAESKTIVYGDAETWNGYDLSEKTVGKHELTYTTQNIYGCDSIVTLTLTVNKQATLDVNVPFEFCEGDSETFRGVTYSTAGVTTVPATGIVRDTNYVVSVKVNQPSSFAEAKTIVYGDAETWNGYDLSEKAVGQHELSYTTTNAAGCDSVVTLTLTVNKQATLVVSVPFEFCEGGSETFRGVTYSTAGTFDVSAIGDVRDTTYVVDVTVNQPSAYTEAKTIVVGTEENWNGYYLSEMAVGAFTLKYTTSNAVGCDSVVTLELVVEKLPLLETEQALSFCAGDSVEYRGKWYFEAGTDVITVEGETRDTLENVTITVFEPTYEERFDSVRVSDVVDLGDIVWTVGEETITGSYEVKESDLGDHVFEYIGQTLDGCAAVVKLFVHVEPKDNSAINIINQMENGKWSNSKYIRNGQLFILRDGKTFNAQGARVE